MDAPPPVRRSSNLRVLVTLLSETHENEVDSLETIGEQSLHQLLDAPIRGYPAVVQHDPGTQGDGRRFAEKRRSYGRGGPESGAVVNDLDPPWPISAAKDLGDLVVHRDDSRGPRHEPTFIGAQELACGCRKPERGSGLDEELMRIVHGRHIPGQVRRDGRESGQVV